MPGARPGVPHEYDKKCSTASADRSPLPRLPCAGRAGCAREESDSGGLAFALRVAVETRSVSVADVLGIREAVALPKTYLHPAARAASARTLSVSAYAGLDRARRLDVREVGTI
jgi:hypothetical protein